jgi:hypothetical protein
MQENVAAVTGVTGKDAVGAALGRGVVGDGVASDAALVGSSFPSQVTGWSRVRGLAVSGGRDEFSLSVNVQFGMTEQGFPSSPSKGPSGVA